MNEYFEYLRIFLYAIGGGLLWHLSVIFIKLRPLLLAFSFYFAMWFMLLFIQINSPDKYRTVANLVSTPALFVIVLVIIYNVWTTRRE